MLEPFTEAVSIVGHNAAKNINDNYRYIDSAKKQADDQIERLKSFTEFYVTNGYADLANHYGYINAPVHGGGWGNKTWDWCQYFRKLAKSMQRPFVYVRHASRWSSNAGVQIHIPIRRATRVLASTLFIACDQQRHNTVEWIFQVNTEQLGAWQDFVRADPDCRRALGLTPLRNPKR